MKNSFLLRFLKNWTLPVAITVGVSVYLLFALTPRLAPAGDVLGPVFERLLPATIFATLFVTFSKVDYHRMRPCRWHACILAAQLLLIVLIVAAILGAHHLPFPILHSSSYKLLLEVILICVIAPCASASPVVTAKLGGDITQMTTFVLISSTIASLLIPAVFPVIEPHAGSTFTAAFLTILKRLTAVLLLPLVLGAIVRHWVLPLHRWFLRTPDLGFYLWCVSLSITAGLTMRNILLTLNHQPSSLFVAIALLALITALVQFAIGRIIGRATGEHICTGQAMFQKNTGLAIWIAFVYLTPEASIGAGCYVLWQNLINSYELWQHRHSGASSPDTAATPTAAQKSTHP